jgi:hypothetical protein
MLRKSPPLIESKGVQTQAIARSQRANLKQSTKNCPKNHRKTTKTRGSYLPEPKVLRIQQRYINGENKSEISKKEKVDRGTVARIVKFPEVQGFIAQMQQEFFGLIPDAMEVIRHSLRVEKNPAFAYRVLEGTGVAPHQRERLQLPDTISSETGYERQVRLVSNVLLEGRKGFDIDLPEDLEAALVKEESRACKEGAKSSAKGGVPLLPRRANALETDDI